MIKVNPDPTFTETIEITAPGRKKPVNVTLTFKYRTADELATLWKVSDGKKPSDVFADIVVGWSGFDKDYTDESREEFLKNYPSAFIEISAAYQDLLIWNRA